GALIEVHGELPVAAAHRSLRCGGRHDVEAVQADVAVGAAVYVEGQDDVAVTARGRGLQRALRRNRAFAHDVAGAVLEVVALDVPFHLSCAGHGVSFLSLNIADPKSEAGSEEDDAGRSREVVPPRR